jgi:hypothetical protein
MTEAIVCRMCGRALRSERSQRIGMGPACAKKFGGLLEREYLEAQGQMVLFPPGRNDQSQGES